MTNEELNTALYQKMFAEQETYRKWLLEQPPEEILKHTYEYTVREDILLSLEYHDLTDAQTNALMKSPNPLGDVFHEFEQTETSYMDTVFDSMVRRADAVIQAEAEQRRKRRSTPIRQAMPASMGSWNSTALPAKPTSPAREPLKRRFRSITVITGWGKRRRWRSLTLSAWTGRSMSLPPRSGTWIGTGAFPAATKNGQKPSRSLRTWMPGAMTATRNWL